MKVELSAVTGFASGDIETCNDRLSETEAFSVYIQNPYSLQIKDFPVVAKFGSSPSEYGRNFIETYHKAWKWANTLSNTLECELDVKCSEPKSIKIE